MNKLKTIFSILVLTVAISATAKQIPLEDFFKDAKFLNIKISPNSEHIAFTYDEGNLVKLAVMNLKDKKIKSSFEFGENTRIFDFYWSTDDRVLMQVARFVGFLDRKGGPASLFAANIDGSKRIRIFEPQRSGYQILSLLRDDPKNILIGKQHFTDRGEIKVNKLNIFNGKVKYLADQPPEAAFGLLADQKGSVRLGVYSKYDEDKFNMLEEYKIFYKKPSSEEWNEMSIPLTKDRTIFRPQGLSPDNRYAYVYSNHETETLALYKYDLLNGKGEKVYENERVDVGSLVRAYDRTVIGVRSMPDYPEIEFLEPGHKESKLHGSLMSAFPDSVVSITSYSNEGKSALVRVTGDTNPGDFYLFDTDTLKAKYIASTRPWLKPKDMAFMEPIKVKARDGVELHGYLTLPKGKTKSLPLIINPHGGPHGPRDSWSFNPEIQFLANRGYAVLQINFRGSGGYGQAFEESGYRKWGREMQNDVTDATLWAVEKGYADPDRICIYGGSYGGYASLQGVVREPDLYKCALGYVGVYDLKEMFVSGDIPKRKSGVKYLEHILGTDDSVLKANSPAYNVDKIKADLFIAHGEDDVRVSMPQYEHLIDALKKAGKPHKTMLRDEGHGYQKEENKYDFYSAMETFFEKNIGK